MLLVWQAQGAHDGAHEAVAGGLFFGWRNGFFLNGGLLGQDRLHLARVYGLLENRAVSIRCGEHIERGGRCKDHRDFAGEEFARHFEDISAIEVNVEDGRIDAAAAEKAYGVKGRGGGADDCGAEMGKAAAKIGSEGFVVFNDEDALSLKRERWGARVY